MKQILLLLCTLILIVTGVFGQQPERGAGIGPGHFGARRYMVKGEEFSVILPAVPAMTTSKIPRRDGKQRTQRYLTTSARGVVYSIEVFENPKPRQPFEEFIAERNSLFQYDPASERTLTVDGFTGKEYSSQNKTSPTVVQFFATEKRLFRRACPDLSGISFKKVSQPE